MCYLSAMGVMNEEFLEFQRSDEIKVIGCKSDSYN